MEPSKLAKRVWLPVFLAVIAFYFYGLGHIPFVGPDEPRYAQVAREMFHRNDFVTPTLGGHTWFEKPALLYWMIVASFRFWGISEGSTRLSSAVSGLLTVVAVFWVSRTVCRSSVDRSLGPLGPWSALLAASTLGLIVFSRGVGFDIVVTMTTTWALSFFLLSDIAENEKRRRMLLAGFYVFVGLSLLAKGLVGIVVPFGVVAAYYVLRRELPARRLLLSLIWGLPLAMAVAAIWYVPVIARHGWSFVNEFFLQHHFARYWSNKYHHPQPFYFYFLIIIPLSLPWTAFLIEGLLKARDWEWRPADPMARMQLFALAWFGFPLVFFSFSGSKLPGYILPVLPAAALIAGERLAWFVSRDRAGFRAMRLTGGLFAVVVIAGSAYLGRFGGISSWRASIVAAPLVVAAVTCLFPMRIRVVPALAAIGATFVAVILALNLGGTRFADRESARDLIRLADSRGYGLAPVYALHQVDRSAEFYAAGRVFYDRDGDPIKFEGPGEVLEAARRINGTVLVVVPVEYLYQLTGLKSAQTEVIGNNGTVALVAVNERHP